MKKQITNSASNMGTLHQGGERMNGFTRERGTRAESFAKCWFSEL